MARCSYHPDVETGLTCTECGKPICPREMIQTPVGYKCPEHARPKKGQYTYVKPKQLLMAVLAGLGTGVGGGVLLGMFGVGFFLVGLLWGSLVAASVRKASGGHQGVEVGVVAGVSIGLGGLLGMAVGLSPLVTLIAIVVALAQLAVIGR